MAFVTVGCQVEKVTGGWFFAFDDGDVVMMEDGDMITMTITTNPLGKLAVKGAVTVEGVLLTRYPDKEPETVMEQLRLACDGVLGEFERVTGEDRLRMIQYVELRLKQLGSGGDYGLGDWGIGDWILGIRYWILGIGRGGLMV
jgi:hypothetical protein